MYEIDATGIAAWHANNEEHGPICVTGKDDGGLSVNVYHVAGHVVGVEVFNGVLGLVGALGLVPSEPR